MNNQWEATADLMESLTLWYQPQKYNTLEAGWDKHLLIVASTICDLSSGDLLTDVIVAGKLLASVTEDCTRCNFSIDAVTMAG